METASNQQITLLRKLNRKKYRYKEQLFFIEGFRAVKQIIDNEIIKIEALFVDQSQQIWQQPEWQDIKQQHQIYLIESGVFKEVADTDNPQGVLALCRIPIEETTDNLIRKSGIVIATDGIQDPGNLGTIIRTAGWFGIEGILLGKGTVDMFHPKVVRSTAGATGTVPFINCDLDDELPEFESNGWQVLLLDAGPQAHDLRSVRPSGRTIVVAGNEANGIDASLFESNRKSIRIPSSADSKNVESLNVSIALSIALYALAD